MLELMAGNLVLVTLDAVGGSPLCAVPVAVGLNDPMMRMSRGRRRGRAREPAELMAERPTGDCQGHDERDQPSRHHLIISRPLQGPAVEPLAQCAEPGFRSVEGRSRC